MASKKFHHSALNGVPMEVHIIGAGAHTPPVLSNRIPGVQTPPPAAPGTEAAVNPQASGTPRSPSSPQSAGTPQPSGSPQASGKKRGAGKKRGETTSPGQTTPPVETPPAPTTVPAARMLLKARRCPRLKAVPLRIPPPRTTPPRIPPPKAKLPKTPLPKTAPSKTSSPKAKSSVPWTPLRRCCKKRVDRSIAPSSLTPWPYLLDALKRSVAQTLQWKRRPDQAAATTTEVPMRARKSRKKSPRQSA